MKEIEELEERNNKLEEQLKGFFTDDESEGEKSPKGKRRLRTVSLSEIKMDAGGDRSAGTSSAVRENSTPQVTAPYMSFKYAVELIPTFDGHNIPINEFINRCKSAKKMLLPNSEAYFVQSVRGRVQGEAKGALEGMEIQNVDSLCKYLSDIYMPAQNRYMLHGELVRIHQKENEGMVSYTNRVKKLSERIIKATDTSQMTVDARVSTMKKIQAEAVKRLISGLKPEYELKAPKDKDLVNTIQDFIQLEKEIELRKELQSEPTATPNSDYKERRSAVHTVTAESIKCELCEKTGYTADQCYKMINQERREKYMKTVKCYFRNKLGHFARDCYKR